MRLLFALITCCTLLFTCGDDAATTTTGNAELDGAIANAEKESGYVSSGTSCLGKEGQSLCNFLDAALIEKYLPTGAESKGYKDTERSMLSGCSIAMEHPTKTTNIKAGTISMNVPAEYRISLYGINSYDSPGKATTRFRGEFKTLTPEQIASTREKMEAGIQAKIDAGELTQEQGEMAKGFGKAVGKSVWEPVQGVGDLAVWGNALPEKESPTSGTLAVLHGDTKFSLDVDLLESKAESREAAIALAKSIIARCD